MKNQNYILLQDLEVYKLSRQLSSEAWQIYQKLDWQIKKVIGDQFVRSIDSIGANIAEGYGRYHFLDKVRFYYIARASHSEAILHWLDLLKERELINKDKYNNIIKISSEFAPRFNSFIYKISQNAKK